MLLDRFTIRVEDQQLGAEALGSDVFVRRRVERIIIEDGRAVGVETADGDTHRAPVYETVGRGRALPIEAPCASEPGTFVRAHGFSTGGGEMSNWIRKFQKRKNKEARRGKGTRGQLRGPSKAKEKVDG